MKNLKAIITSAFLLSPLCASEAATLSNSHIGNWSIWAYSDDQTGEFSHCAAATQYKSGISMLFSVNRAYTWSMGFANSQWRLQKGTSYPIAFTVDQVPALNATAVAIRSDTAEVPLADSVALFNVFKRGNWLTVFAAGQVFQFALTDTSKVLPALILCVRNYLQPAPLQAANPFVAAAPTSSAGNSDDTTAVRQAEATAFLANVLSQAAITGYSMLTPADAAKLTTDAAWKTESEFGILTIVDPSANMGPNDIDATLVQKDGKGCQGKFLSGSMSEEKETKGSRLFTSCNSGGQTVTALYTVLPRPNGGYYVLGTLSEDQAQNSDASPARSIDASIRAAAYKILVK